MSVSHLIQPYTTNFSSIGTSSVKHIKWIARPMPQWVCTSSARANQQHWPTIYPAFPTTLVEAMWDVWCLFSIIAAMICIGSGTKCFFTANKETHHWRWRKKRRSRFLDLLFFLHLERMQSWHAETVLRKMKCPLRHQGCLRHKRDK